MVGDEILLALAGLGLSHGPTEARAAAAWALGQHGDFPAGFAQLAALAELEVAAVSLDQDAPESELGPGGPSLLHIERTLRGLMPWRKGPFLLSRPGEGTLLVDAEWRSDLKWQRLLELGPSLTGKRVLDVGTGNGYFLLRLLGAGAAEVSGVEPSLRSVLQFLAIRALFGSPGCSLWPLRLEQLPPMLGTYDTVMSMGVLYHQREPTEHLRLLRRLIAPGGELVLETIVQESTLSIEKGARYAGMRNVYVIPSQAELCSWLDRAGYQILRAGAVRLTTSAEQRRAEFAEGPSLDDVLEPVSDLDHPGRRTREGHPRPARWALRAIPKTGAR